MQCLARNVHADHFIQPKTIFVLHFRDKKQQNSVTHKKNVLCVSNVSRVKLQSISQKYETPTKGLKHNLEAEQQYRM